MDIIEQSVKVFCSVKPITVT